MACLVIAKTLVVWQLWWDWLSGVPLGFFQCSGLCLTWQHHCHRVWCCWCVHRRVLIELYHTGWVLHHRLDSSLHSLCGICNCALPLMLEPVRPICADSLCTFWTNLMVSMTPVFILILDQKQYRVCTAVLGSILDLPMGLSKHSLQTSPLTMKWYLVPSCLLHCPAMPINSFDQCCHCSWCWVPVTSVWLADVEKQCNYESKYHVGEHSSQKIPL